ALSRGIANDARREGGKVEKITTVDRQVLNGAFVYDGGDRGASCFHHLAFGGHVNHRHRRVTNCQLNVERCLTADSHDDVGESGGDKSLRAAGFNLVRAGWKKDDSIDAFVVCLRALLESGGEIRRSHG